MNSEDAALQLRMEDSRKGWRSRKKDFHHLIHTWMEEMVKKAIVYNTKKEEKKGNGRKSDWKKKRERKREQKGLKK